MQEPSEPRYAGVYAIDNKLTGERYIGSAVNIHYRWRAHRSSLGQGRHANLKLQAAWHQYGADGFEFSVLEAMYGVTNPNQLRQQEAHWLRKMHDETGGFGYNGATFGIETAEKIRQSYEQRQDIIDQLYKEIVIDQAILLAQNNLPLDKVANAADDACTKFVNTLKQRGIRRVFVSTRNVIAEYVFTYTKALYGITD